MNTMVACIDGGLFCVGIPAAICLGTAWVFRKLHKVCKRSCKCHCHPSNKLALVKNPAFPNNPADYEWFHVGQIVNVAGESFTKGIIKRIVEGVYIRVEDYENAGSEETRAEEAEVYPSQLSPNTDNIMHGV